MLTSHFEGEQRIVHRISKHTACQFLMCVWILISTRLACSHSCLAWVDEELALHLHCRLHTIDWPQWDLITLPTQHRYQWQLTTHPSKTFSTHAQSSIIETQFLLLPSPTPLSIILLLLSLLHISVSSRLSVVNDLEHVKDDAGLWDDISILSEEEVHELHVRIDHPSFGL